MAAGRAHRRPVPVGHRRELTELGGKVRDLVDEYFERLVKPELRPEGARLVTFLHLAFPRQDARERGRAVARQRRRRGGAGSCRRCCATRCSAVLERVHRVHGRGPGHTDRGAADRGARAARGRGRDGAADGARMAAEPAVRHARRGLGRPARPAAAADDRLRPRAVRAARHRPGLLGARRAHPRAAARRRVRGRDAVHPVQRRRPDAVRVDRRAGAVRGRAVAHLRQPGHVVRRSGPRSAGCSPSCSPRRSRSSRTRCRSSGRRSSCGGSTRPSRRPTTGRAASPRGCGSSPAPPSCAPR